ncbi:MAG TPA: cupin domain-containing protein [Dehalococcoidia bacterium]|nr:cupin domain-containing protein [Dehalococcoidia bacterium]
MEDEMPAQVRRVVTGHDAQGRAVVKRDETLDLDSRGVRANVAARVIWTSESFPVENTGDEDTADRASGLTLANGTVFRVVEFAPGNAPRMHRTDSIDYAVVISGEIDMELDDEVVHLKAGDVLVQRGTIHNWLNRGSEPCRIAFVLIDAKPVAVAGTVLHAAG